MPIAHLNFSEMPTDSLKDLLRQCCDEYNDFSIKSEAADQIASVYFPNDSKKRQARDLMSSDFYSFEEWRAALRALTKLNKATLAKQDLKKHREKTLGVIHELSSRCLGTEQEEQQLGEIIDILGKQWSTQFLLTEFYQTIGIPESYLLNFKPAICEFADNFWRQESWPLGNVETLCAFAGNNECSLSQMDRFAMFKHICYMFSDSLGISRPNIECDSTVRCAHYNHETDTINVGPESLDSGFDFLLKSAVHETVHYYQFHILRFDKLKPTLIGNGFENYQSNKSVKRSYGFQPIEMQAYLIAEFCHATLWGTEKGYNASVVFDLAHRTYLSEDSFPYYRTQQKRICCGYSL